MQIPFPQRLASMQWEPLPLSRLPGVTLWAWYRPQSLPHGVSINVPPQLQAAYPMGLPFTFHDLLMSAGIAFQQFQAVSLYGGPWQPAAVFLGVLNHGVPVVAAGVLAEIRLTVFEHVPPVIPMPPAEFKNEDSAMNLDETVPATSSQMYDRMESSWKKCIQMERQMTGLRQKLSGTLSSLNKLDRELTPEERLAADREDKDNWEDARRWVRDLASKCHREIKQFDIGMTSSAGHRSSIQSFYEEIIEPRRPCDQLEAHRRDFQVYLKGMTCLQRAMVAAASAASQNGLQRSQRVLSTLQKKIQERRRRRREPLGATNMDKSCRKKR